MGKKKLSTEILSALFEIETLIKVVSKYYNHANALWRFGIAYRYHRINTVLHKIKVILWNVNRKGYIKHKDTQIAPLEKPIYQYKLSSELIHRIFEYLIDDGENEKYCYGTGVIDKENTIIIPTEILTPKMSKQSPVYVEGDLRSIRDALLYLDKFRHTVVIQCHRHPGSGKGSCYPSSIDIKNHTDWEAFYPLIGIIFVKDGYFRFFSARRKFRVEIYGAGVRKIDGVSFQITRKESD